MLKKKLLACLLASAMLLSLATTSFATDPNYDDFDADDLGAQNGVNTGGSGDIEFLDLTKEIKVVLPTEKAFDFKVDPQGLLGASGASTSLSDLEEEAGKIVFNEAPPIINNSAVPIVVTAGFQVTGNATHLVIPAADSPLLAGGMADGTAALPEPSAKTLLTGGEIVERLSANTNNTVSVFMSPGAESISEPTEGYDSSGLGYVLGAGMSTFKFILDAAEYTVDVTNPTDKKLALTPGTGNGTKLQLGGFVNPKANWSAYTLPAKIPVPPTAIQGGAAAKIWGTGAEDGSTGTTLIATNRTAFPTATVPDPKLLVKVPSSEITGTATTANTFNVDSDGNLRRGTLQLYAADATVAAALESADADALAAAWTAQNGTTLFALNATINVGDFKEAYQNNAAARTMNVTANFRFTIATEPEKTQMARPFGWGAGVNDTNAFNAAGDGFANRTVVDAGVTTREPVAYGLMGFSVNAMRVISVEFAPSVGFARTNINVPIGEIVGANRKDFVFKLPDGAPVPAANAAITNFKISPNGGNGEFFGAGNNATAAATGTLPLAAPAANGLPVATTHTYHNNLLATDNVIGLSFSNAATVVTAAMLTGAAAPSTTARALQVGDKIEVRIVAGPTGQTETYTMIITLTA